jgi:type I restriction enzyme S subunit
MIATNEWQTTTLGDLISRAGCFIQTGPFGSQLHKRDYQETGIGTVNPTHLENNRINQTKVPRVSRETADRLQRHRLVEGDILFARRGEIGRHSLVSEAEDGWLPVKRRKDAQRVIHAG